ncbi:2360_t:CDS:2, partial [Gigaspora rosea]
IIIEKEIKEGRYITNNKLAKVYPKTYTLYNKRLINWKTKIEEQYYESLGKPFIVYWFDNKNWFDGYDKQPILILDNFDGTQLYYSTFLKILSGQQRRLEIKGSKELNYIKHVIITSNYSLKELYRKDDYNRDLRLQHRQYLDSIDYFQYFEENWKTDSKINNDNYLPIEKIRTILAKRNKNNQSDSKT